MTPLAVCGQRAALGPQRRKFTRGVEFLHRGSLGLAVEIAQRFRAQHTRAVCRRPADPPAARCWQPWSAPWRARRPALRPPRRAARQSWWWRSSLVAGVSVWYRRGGSGDRRRMACSCRRRLRLALAASCAGAAVSSLKSLMVGGGRFAGSGRGIAASIASSAALLRAGSVCANAEVADTVRKVAATAISTRSNPARFFKQSRIVTPLGRNCPGMEQFLLSSVQLLLKRRPHRFLKRHSVNVCSQCFVLS